MKLSLAVLILLTLSSPESSEAEAKILYVFDGRISHQVTDGDVVLFNSRGKTIKIRLTDIDAPEPSQEYGDTSAQFLQKHVGNRRIKAECFSRDKSGRYHCYLLVGAKNINFEMIRHGLAWALTDQASDPYLKQLETLAQQEKLGLWSNPDPMPPWEFRDQALKNKKAQRVPEPSIKSKKKKKKVIKLSF